MPLVLQAAIVWVAGTAIGLRGGGVAGVLVATLLLGLWLLWRAIAGSPDRLWRADGAAGLGLLVAVALTLGADVARADRRCALAARAARTWLVRVGGDAIPSGFATGVIVGAADGTAAPTATRPIAVERCRVRVALAVRRGSAAAGSLVRVTGAELSEGDRGLLLRETVVTTVEPPGPLARWRNRVAAAIARRFDSDAGVAKALLIADTDDLSAEIRDRYAGAGLVHILSISGLHVGIIGAALLLLVEAARLPATAGRLGALAVVALYVLAIGAPAAAVRSAVLFAGVTATRLLQRPTSPWATFALGAVVPLVQPRTVLDLGWQLSVAGYAGVIAAGRVARRALPHGWRGWRAGIARELIAGAMTTAATAPLVAWHFGRLSLIAVISNLGAGPVVALLQPTLFLAMLAPTDSSGRFVADAARPMLRALDAVAALAAGVPGGAITVAPTLFVACAAAAGAAAVIVAAWARHWRPWLALAIGCVALLAWMPQQPIGRSRALEVHLLDVGQGDAVALRTPAGRWVLVDAGRQWSSGDAGRATVIPYLRRRGGALSLFVLTHPHADHLGGAVSVVDRLRPPLMRDAAFVTASDGYAELLRHVQRRGVSWARVRPGERMLIDGVSLEFLAPDSAWTVALDDPNEASTVLRVQYGGRSVLLTGDAERGLEEWLLAHARGRLDVDVLKVGHHGSNTSSIEAFVRAVSPRLALVSVGRDNSYGHPSPDVMQRLLDAGATVLRTDQLGTIVLRTDGVTWDVAAAGHRWSVREDPAPLP